MVMMEWLPSANDFRADLAAASLVTDPAERLARLAALAGHQLGYVETILLDRALGRIADDIVPGWGFVRLALLGSATLDHLGPAIRVAGLRRRLRIQVFTGGYGQYRQELLEPAAALVAFAPQVVLLSLTAREVIQGIPLTATPAEVDAGLDHTVAQLAVLWDRARGLGASVLQQTLLETAEPLFGSLDRQVPGSPGRLVALLNDRLSASAAREGVVLVDVARASARDGLDAWYDAAKWLQAKIEIAPSAAPAFGELVARVLGAQRGLSRKCLVLDLDNTLWGGVIGDDGLEGIVLGEGSAAGEAHLALQRYAKLLGQRGVILAVCSKNDPRIAESVFLEHPEMVLRRSDIAAFVANWEDKTENLKRIASQLNIGLDSLVFVDDNPAERARIRQSLPVVAVPELPADADGYARRLADAGYFEAVAFTAEDVQRVEQYAANASREALLESSQSMDDYLQALAMEVRFGPVGPVDLARVTQLINKTNQFNPTTRRYSVEEVAAICADDEGFTLQLRLTDRFGDNGLVSAALLRPDTGDPEALEIDTWVMSCRVFGRQLEVEAMNLMVETARRRGVRRLRAAYIPTPKNGVVSQLYPELGFTRLTDGTEGSATWWVLPLADYVTRPTYITRRADWHD
jgi:FkbH-like protein